MIVSALLPGSLGTLAVGPLISRYIRSRPAVFAFIDGFIVVSIGGLVLLDVLPQALGQRDIIALLSIAVGFLVPDIVERMFRYGARQTHAAILIAALLGVAVHSMLDGSALAESSSQAGNLLGYGVLLHQIPVGLMVWWVLRDRALWTPWAVLGFMAVMTIVGYVAEPTVLAWLPERASLWFEAVVGGSLLHVIAHAAHEHDSPHEGHPGHGDHNHDHDHTERDSGSLSHPMAAGAGSLAGILVLVVLQYLEGGLQDPYTLQIAAALWQLLASAAPALIFAYGAVAIWLTFVFVRQHRRLRAAASADASGQAAEPISATAVVRLRAEQQDATFPLIAALFSVPLLGVALALANLALSQLITSLRTVALAAHHADGSGSGLKSHQVLYRAEEPSRAWRLAVERSVPWVVVGLLVAALLVPLLADNSLATLPPTVGVLLATIIAALLPLPALALVPTGAVLASAGLSLGAVLAMLVAASQPALWRSFGVAGDAAAGQVPQVARASRPPRARSGIRMLVAAAAGGMLFDFIAGSIDSRLLSQSLSADAGMLSSIATALFIMLVLGLVGQRGIRAFAAPLHYRPVFSREN